MKSYLGELFAIVSILLMAFITVGLFVSLCTSVASLINYLGDLNWFKSLIAFVELVIFVAANYLWYSKGRAKWMELNHSLQMKLFKDTF